MAKAARTTETIKRVPDAEPVGGPIPIVQADADLRAPDTEIGIDRTLYPHLADAMFRYFDARGDLNFTGVRITTRLDGLRRGGERHVGTNDWPIGKFEPYQLNQIFGDRDLIAELIELD